MLSGMKEIVDVPGASGALYRFRRAELPALPAIAGNLVVVRRRRSGIELLACSPAPSLADACDLVRSTLAAHRGAAVYVRLNVARAVREAEHADIIAAAAGLRKGGDPSATVADAAMAQADLSSEAGV